MPTIEFPINETFRAIRDRFPNSLVSRYLNHEPNPDITLVQLELYKIVTGNDLDGGYNSETDIEDAKRFLALLANPTIYIPDEI